MSLVVVTTAHRHPLSTSNRSGTAAHVNPVRDAKTLISPFPTPHPPPPAEIILRQWYLPIQSLSRVLLMQGSQQEMCEHYCLMELDF